MRGQNIHRAFHHDKPFTHAQTCLILQKLGEGALPVHQTSTLGSIYVLLFFFLNFIMDLHRVLSAVLLFLLFLYHLRTSSAVLLG